MPVTVSVLLAIHDKPPETVQAVLGALRSEYGGDSVLVVLDRPTEAILSALGAIPGAIVLPGVAGWRSPCIACNAGLARIEADITVINQGDVEQAAGNLAVVEAHFQAHPDSVLFGNVVETAPEILEGPGHAGPILCSASNPRALTHLIAVPTKALKAIGGWDEAFQEGVCYEDDDLTARLWKHGLDFYFDDRFSGRHHSHQRAYYKPFAVALNLGHMLRKHGKDSAYRVAIQTGMVEVKKPGRTIWKHA